MVLVVKSKHKLIIHYSLFYMSDAAHVVIIIVS